MLVDSSWPLTDGSNPYKLHSSLISVDIRVQQKLLRHSTIQSTMNIYTQAMSEGERTTNGVVVWSVLPFETCGAVSRMTRGKEREPIRAG